MATCMLWHLGAHLSAEYYFSDTCARRQFLLPATISITHMGLQFHKITAHAPVVVIFFEKMFLIELKAFKSYKLHKNLQFGAA